jgi:cytochrome c oxidase cbb3-type subunit 4
MINGIYTALLLIIFIAIVFWAWSKENKESFDKNAQMPLIDEDENQNGEKS